MNNATHRLRWELLQIVAAVGAIRDVAPLIQPEGQPVVDRELQIIQSAAHRLFDLLDVTELPVA